ncbi:MAG TPA: DUF488 domain-containing protein [Edaphobacter sp.]
MLRFYTIGHSSHAAERFVDLVKRHGIEVLVDTRSAPYSKFSPQFDRELLRDLVTAAGVRYLYMGDVVGGRPKEKGHYDEQGRVLYSRVAESAEFLDGIARLERGAAEYRVALMCSEEDPAHCHRRLLIGRVLSERGAELLHIRGTGELQAEVDVARASGKEIAEKQPALFAELEEARWRSTASVLRKGQQPNSSAR